MKHAAAARQTRRQADRRPRSKASSNLSPASMAPPDYGIDFVDREQSPATHLQRSPAMSVQGQFDPVQRQDLEDEELVQGRFAGSELPTQRQGVNDAVANRTGMPDSLKAGLEQLSGMDLSGVRVHQNSAKPAQLNALAYAQGQDIHLGPGQERHLPHEAWHAVQQMQGRVKPTMRAQGVSINDDEGLEHEADVMGAKASQRRHKEQPPTRTSGQKSTMLQQKGASAKALTASNEKGYLNFLHNGMFNSQQLIVQRVHGLTEEKVKAEIERRGLSHELMSTEGLVEYIMGIHEDFDDLNEILDLLFQIEGSEEKEEEKGKIEKKSNKQVNKQKSTHKTPPSHPKPVNSPKINPFSKWGVGSEDVKKGSGTFNFPELNVKPQSAGYQAAYRKMENWDRLKHDSIKVAMDAEEIDLFMAAAKSLFTGGFKIFLTQNETKYGKKDVIKITNTGAKKIFSPVDASSKGPTFHVILN